MFLSRPHTIIASPFGVQFFPSLYCNTNHGSRILECYRSVRDSNPYIFLQGYIENESREAREGETNHTILTMESDNSSVLYQFLHTQRFQKFNECWGHWKPCRSLRIYLQHKLLISPSGCHNNFVAKEFWLKIQKYWIEFFYNTNRMDTQMWYSVILFLLIYLWYIFFFASWSPESSDLRLKKCYFCNPTVTKKIPITEDGLWCKYHSPVTKKQNSFTVSGGSNHDGKQQVHLGAILNQN
ncbi:hypothetical protein VP01_1380g1 [Puccinia sorghi]|uniref:Uncharacterized protein n=1 Tax=Puccinia sorghi TaxID=27349 RepID=A0A0L6VLE4_9BASI|nr:hypothetical protein VP01_1380g1 [Puccinia sorghi]